MLLGFGLVPVLGAGLGSVLVMVLGMMFFGSVLVTGAELVSGSADDSPSRSLSLAALPQVDQNKNQTRNTNQGIPIRSPNNGLSGERESRKASVTIAAPADGTRLLSFAAYPNPSPSQWFSLA